MKRTLLDTNIYIDWLNHGLHEELVVGRGRVRLLSAVVLMELRIGATTTRAEKAVQTIERAYASGQRISAPSSAAYHVAGGILRNLRKAGREIRRASLVNDTLIALTARSLGAVIYTRDGTDFEAIREHCEFSLEVVA